MGSPNTALACWHRACTKGWLPGRGLRAWASSRRLTSMLMPGDCATASAITWRRVASTSAGFSSGIMRRSSLSTTLPGTTLVLVPPSIRPTFR